jgi:hypothetical protein
VGHGLAVLRFEFTGLGYSEGEFANGLRLSTMSVHGREQTLTSFQAPKSECLLQTEGGRTAFGLVAPNPPFE